MNNSIEILPLIIEYESRLHKPEQRLDLKTVEALLHKDFVEIGRSGNLTDRKEIIESLLSEINQPEIHAEQFALSWINDETVILTYRSFSYADHVELVKERHTLRSSVWIKTTQHGWQMRFHQGTPSKAW